MCICSFQVTGGVLLEHDLTCDRGGDPTPESMCRLYFLQSQGLIARDPPLPTKSERILFYWSHATDVGALWNMLKDRDMLPMNARGVEKFGFTPWDTKSAALKLMSTISAESSSMQPAARRIWRASS